ncbi:multidrug resistance protein MdtA precursor [mine drainage metagenome]|uniref:Multidrug resistance protein MdtA n=1 Tax=mine drainage metagenome TaxID=410659 RepID=A0A1J5T8T0_9ZZZZ
MRINTTIGIAIISLLIACNSKPKEIAKPEDDAILVRTTMVETSDYKPILQYSGMMASTNEVKLSFKIGGIVSKIYVKEGDHVSKGQLLATLNLTEINAQVEQSTQAVEKAKRDANRVKNLYHDTAATLEQFQNVQTQLDVAKENQRIAKFNLEYAQIRALDNGTVIKKISNEGEMIAAGSPVFIINSASNNDWVVRFGVADKDWSVLKKDDAASVVIDAYPNKTFKGIISKKAESADPYSNTYEIEVKVLPNGEKFASGLFATVQLKAATVKALKLIPIEALSEADDKKGFVFVLNSDKKTVKKVAIKIAFINNDKVAISSGLENINEVITDGVSYLTETSTVKIAQ